MANATSYTAGTHLAAKPKLRHKPCRSDMPESPDYDPVLAVR